MFFRICIRGLYVESMLCGVFKNRCDGFFFFSTSMMHSSINRRQMCRLRCKLIRRTPCHTLLIIVCSSTPWRLPQIPLGIVLIRYLLHRTILKNLAYKKREWKIVLFSRRIFCILSATDIMKINHAKWFISVHHTVLFQICWRLVTRRWCSNIRRSSRTGTNYTSLFFTIFLSRIRWFTV